MIVQRSKSVEIGIIVCKHERTSALIRLSVYWIRELSTVCGSAAGRRHYGVVYPSDRTGPDNVTFLFITERHMHLVGMWKYSRCKCTRTLAPDAKIRADRAYGYVRARRGSVIT